MGGEGGCVRGVKEEEDERESSHDCASLDAERVGGVDEGRWGRGQGAKERVLGGMGNRDRGGATHLLVHD
jgi:hypothetical protein